MGWGRDASNVHTSKLQLINTYGWTVYLNWTDKKGKTENTIICLKYFKFNVWTAIHSFQLARCSKHGSSY